MKASRIKAIIVEHLLLMINYLGLLVDTFYWPIMDVIIWGFMMLYLNRLGETTEAVVAFLMGGLILWTIAWRSQQDISVSFLFDVWNQNLVNLFTTPLTVWEFLIAVIILGLIKILLTVGAMALVAYLFYSYSLWSLGFSFLPLFANLLLFGWWVGIAVTGLILFFGRQIQSFAWGFIVLLQPISCVYYPLKTLPDFLQPIARLMPTTWIFEGMRAVLTKGSLPTMHLVWATGLNLVYLVLSVFFFRWLFEKSRERGRLAKLEE